MRACGSSASTAASTQALPQITALSRASTRARAVVVGAISAAVRSPAPTSSASARATSARASSATFAALNTNVFFMFVSIHAPFEANLKEVTPSQVKFIPLKGRFQTRVSS